MGVRVPLPPRCNDCEWIDVRTYGDTRPDLILGMPCDAHAPPLTDREIERDALRAAWAELDAIDRANGLR